MSAEQELGRAIADALDLARRLGRPVTLAPGSRFEMAVRPSDTPRALAERAAALIERESARLRGAS